MKYFKWVEIGQKICNIDRDNEYVDKMFFELYGLEYKEYNSHTNELIFNIVNEKKYLLFLLKGPI